MLRMRYTTCIRCIKYLPGPEPTSMLWHEHDRIFFQVTSQICREASSHGNTLFGFNQMHQRWPCQRRLLGWALIDTGLGETMSLYVKQITQLYGDFSYFQLKYICFGDVFNKSPTIGTSIPIPAVHLPIFFLAMARGIHSFEAIATRTTPGLGRCSFDGIPPRLPHRRHARHPSIHGIGMAAPRVPRRNGQGGQVDLGISLGKRIL